MIMKLYYHHLNCVIDLCQIYIGKNPGGTTRGFSWPPPREKTNQGMFCLFPILAVFPAVNTSREHYVKQLPALVQRPSPTWQACFHTQQGRLARYAGWVGKPVGRKVIIPHFLHLLLVLS